MRDAPATAATETIPGFNIWLTPFMLLNSWTPLLAGTSYWNHQAHQGLSTLNLEWQDFLARRFKEDAGLLNKIATSTSPDQLWSAYASFWEKAMDDYGAEFARMTKLVAGVTAKNLAATQQAAGEESKHAGQIAIAKAA